MKRIVSVILAVVLVMSSCCFAFAANLGKVTYSKNTSLRNKFNSFESLTLKAGVTLSTGLSGSEPQGIEMHGPLVLEEGAKITGKGIILMYRGSSYSGMDFWYQLASGELRKMPDMDTAYEKYQNAADYVFTFAANRDGKWVLEDVLTSDPFEEPKPHGPAAITAQDCAEALYKLKLMKGVGTLPDGSVDFALDESLTRVEAIVMMIRLLGKENEVLSGSWSHPFIDVPAWADKYIGYAFEKGITNGEDLPNGIFGTEDATGVMYLTMVLRAMGYNDSAALGPVDFNWSESDVLARNIGISLTMEQVKNFTRSEAAIASLLALKSATKDGTHLSRKLISENVFPADQYEAVIRAFE